MFNKFTAEFNENMKNMLKKIIKVLIVKNDPFLKIVIDMVALQPDYEKNINFNEIFKFCLKK